MNKKTSKLLSEAKSDLELAIVKSLSKAPLNPTELDEVLSITETDLLKDHDLDLYMTQQIKWHAKNEQFRLRAQNLYTPLEGAEDLYPEKPYTRTNPIDESSSVARVSKRQLRRIIKEEKARLTESAPFPVASRAHPDFAAAVRGDSPRLNEQSRTSREGEILADLAITSDAISSIHDEMYGLVMPGGPQAPDGKRDKFTEKTYGDELADRLQTEIYKLENLQKKLEDYFLTVDDLAGRNPGGSIG